jgi:hypothetical protein
LAVLTVARIDVHDAVDDGRTAPVQRAAVRFD